MAYTQYSLKVCHLIQYALKNNKKRSVQKFIFDCFYSCMQNRWCCALCEFSWLT